METTTSEHFLDSIIETQVEAYNNRDLDGFVKHYDQHVKVVLIPENKLIINGIADFKSYYSSLFKAYPSQKAVILNRMVGSHVVIDHERVTGRDKELDFLIVYCLNSECKIFNVSINAL